MARESPGAAAPARDRQPVPAADGQRPLHVAGVLRDDDAQRHLAIRIQVLCLLYRIRF
jgi:hypothetical protein